MYIYTVTIALYLLVYSFFLSPLLSCHTLSPDFLIMKKKKKRPNINLHHPATTTTTITVTQNHQNTISTTRPITTPYNSNTKLTHNQQKIKSKSTKNQQKSRPNDQQKITKVLLLNPKKPISPQPKKTHASWLLLPIRLKEWVADQDWRIKRVKLGLGWVRSRKG